MKLSEKIYDCRKKSGKSQEVLAEELGVSRQAVSKWETGEAEPEIGKLKRLAEIFGVTADWLLSEEEPAEEQAPGPEAEPEPEPKSAPAQSAGASWVDSLPGALGRLLRRYGWLVGVYLAAAGGAFFLLGALARALVRSMLSSFARVTDSMFSGFGNSAIVYGSLGDPFGGGVSQLAHSNPVSVLGAVMMVFGAVLVICGVILAVVLKKRGGGKGK